MIETLKKMFGSGNSTDLKKIIDEGATILDVRTKGEYAGGHVKGSINIPLNALQNDMKKLDKSKPVVTCCASGMRSATAKGILESHGFTVYNGGGWMNVHNKPSQS